MSLTVLSYNVRYAELDSGENLWEKRRDGVASLIRFHEPDIVCLQEVWQDQLSDLRERLPGYKWAAKRHNDGEHTPIGYRPERVSVEDVTVFSLSETPEDLDAIGWEAAVPRVSTAATFRKSGTGRDVRVVNTHFDHLSEGARERSAEFLADRFGDHSTLLVGDFNCTPKDAPYETLLDAGFRDARETVDRPHGPETTFNDFERPQPGKRIDHVFVDNGIAVERFGVITDLDSRGLYPSDHFAVYAELEL